MEGVAGKRGAHKKNQRTWELARRFSRVIRSISQKDTRVVISLGGGGVRMFAHAEFLRLMDELQVAQYIDEIWGASGGAIMGMLYSLGVAPEEMKSEADKIYKKLYFMPKLPSYLTMAGRILKDAVLPSKGQSIMGAFHDYQEALLKIVSQLLNKQEPRYDFFCTAYNMETQSNDTLSISPVNRAYLRDDIYQVDPMDAVAASSALPVLFKPKIIQDSKGVSRTYVEGAMIVEVPTESIYKKWQLDLQAGVEKRRRLLVIAVSLQNNFSSMNLLDHWILKRLPSYEYLMLSLNFADFMRHAKNKAQRVVLTDDPKVELWDLQLEMDGGGVLDLKLIPTVLKAAEKTFPRQLAQINKTLLG